MASHVRDRNHDRGNHHDHGRPPPVDPNQKTCYFLFRKKKQVRNSHCTEKVGADLCADLNSLFPIRTPLEFLPSRVFVFFADSGQTPSPVPSLFVICPPPANRALLRTVPSPDTLLKTHKKRTRSPTLGTHSRESGCEFQNDFFPQKFISLLGLNLPDITNLIL